MSSNNLHQTLLSSLAGNAAGATDGSAPQIKKPKRKKNHLKLIFGVIGLVILIVGSGTAYYLSRQSQEIRQQASGSNCREAKDADSCGGKPGCVYHYNITCPSGLVSRETCEGNHGCYWAGKNCSTHSINDCTNYTGCSVIKIRGKGSSCTGTALDSCNRENNDGKCVSSGVNPPTNTPVPNTPTPTGSNPGDATATIAPPTPVPPIPTLKLQGDTNPVVESLVASKTTVGLNESVTLTAAATDSDFASNVNFASGGNHQIEWNCNYQNSWKQSHWENFPNNACENDRHCSQLTHICTYAQAGTYKIAVRVKDNANGYSHVKTIDVIASSEPTPTPTLIIPTPPSISGAVKDQIASYRLTWQGPYYGNGIRKFWWQLVDVDATKDPSTATAIDNSNNVGKSNNSAQLTCVGRSGHRIRLDAKSISGINWPNVVSSDVVSKTLTCPTLTPTPTITPTPISVCDTDETPAIPDATANYNPDLDRIDFTWSWHGNACKESNAFLWVIRDNETRITSHFDNETSYAFQCNDATKGHTIHLTVFAKGNGKQSGAKKVEATCPSRTPHPPTATPTPILTITPIPTVPAGACSGIKIEKDGTAVGSDVTKLTTGRYMLSCLATPPSGYTASYMLHVLLPNNSTLHHNGRSWNFAFGQPGNYTISCTVSYSLIGQNN